MSHRRAAYRWGDVPLRDAMLCWTGVGPWSVWPGEAPPGSVEVGPHPDLTRWSDRYQSSDGACESDWREDTPQGRLRRLLELFVCLTVAEGVAPAEVHRALLAIPEYRAAIGRYLGTLCPPDIADVPGALDRMAELVAARAGLPEPTTPEAEMAAERAAMLREDAAGPRPRAPADGSDHP